MEYVEKEKEKRERGGSIRSIEQDLDFLLTRLGSASEFYLLSSMQ